MKRIHPLTTKDFTTDIYAIIYKNISVYVDNSVRDMASFINVDDFNLHNDLHNLKII